jgi:hypothetical protein
MTQTPEQREQAAERRECELFYKWLRTIAAHRHDDIGRTAQALITLLECEACAKAMNYDSRAYREWRHMIEDAADAKRARQTTRRKADDERRAKERKVVAGRETGRGNKRSAPISANLSEGGKAVAKVAKRVSTRKPADAQAGKATDAPADVQADVND